MKTFDAKTIIPQAFDWVTVEDFARMDLNDWTAEQKMDGMRCMARYDRGEVVFITRGGRRLVQAAAAQHFAKLEAQMRNLAEAFDFAELALDGEIMIDDGVLWVFDMPYGYHDNAHDYAMEYLPGDAHALRRHNLAVYFEEMDFDAVMDLFPDIRLLPEVTSPDEILALAEEVLASGAEGLVLKDRRAPYDWSGNRTRSTLKLKFKRSADVVVTARDTGMAENVKGETVRRQNAHFAAFDAEGNLVPLGSCSMIGKPDARPGDVIEVEYLSWRPGGLLVQPNMVRIRSTDEKRAVDCRVDQLVAQTKESLR